MQNLMKQIVDMDRHARTITNSAQKEKIDSKKEVAKRQEEIRNKYLAEARNRIAKLEPEEWEAAEVDWKKTEKKDAKLMQQINHTYEEKGDEWISKITKRVTGGIS